MEGREMSVCQVCALIWATLAMGAAFYVVFILERSNWWILAGLLIASCWKCKAKE